MVVNASDSNHRKLVPLPMTSGRGHEGAATCNEPGLRSGIVLQASAGSYVVQPLDGHGADEPLLCSLRGNLKKAFDLSTSSSLPTRVTRARRPRTTDTVAVGDRVCFSIHDDNNGMIEEVLPRISRFVRTAFRGQEQTIVSNLDQVVIVFACNNPLPDPWLIDRWLVAAEANALRPIIVANKFDLVTEAEFTSAFKEFIDLGITVIAASAHNGTGIPQLHAELQNRISAFTGPSGVGKSSLLNVLQPGLQQAVGEVGTVTWKGRHTTTVRRLFPLTDGGWVADTPGLRQIDLAQLDRYDLAQCFIEIGKTLTQPCRFANCRHDTEPDCRVKDAVEAGLISVRRYRSFIQMANASEES